MSHPKPTDVERLRSLNSLLEVGLSLPAEQRTAWLAALPPQHQALIAPLKALLARAEVDTDDFLQQPLLLMQEEAAGEVPIALTPGERIGPHRLVRELGAGGMASVWLAEREDGARRSVALKLPHMGWSAGIDRRVARERDILAGLEHPNIARLYETGVTPEGRPWLAMEYVQGLPLDVHCREQRLDVRQRLALFLQVTDAVVYAHSRLVVHRDLKPSNILVTAQGDVRLLDFGVAKLLQDDEGSAQLTRALGCAVTPDYAAPEQAAGQEITLATDVYTLGIVLYELLTGQRPYSMSGVPLGGLHQALQAASLPLASSRADADVGLGRQLRGDLDTILSKALRKEPAQRYASVEALASDLRRHLAGEPVLAQAPSWRYLARKFAGRHRFGLAAATLLGASLLAGISGTLWQARIAQLERDRALEQLRLAEASEEQLRVALAEAGGRRVTARDIAARVEQQVQQRYRADPALRASLLLQLGGLYLESGAVDDALRATALGREAALTAGQRALAGHADCQQAALLAIVGRNDEARALLPRARARFEPPTQDNAAERLDCHVWASQMQLHLDDLEATRAELEAGLRLIDPVRPAQQRVAGALKSVLAEVLGRRGEYAPAIKLLRQRIEENVANGLSGTTTEEAVLHSLAYMQGSAGQPLAAWQAFESLRARTREAGGKDDPIALTAYARTLNQLGRHAEAATLARQSLTMARELGSPRGEARNLMHLAVAACTGEIGVPCLPAIDEFDRAAQALPGQRTNVFLPHQLRAGFALKAGRADEARAHAIRAIQAQAASSDRGPTAIRLQTLLARIELRREDPAAARTAADRAVAEARQMAAGLDYAEFLGAALAVQAEVHEALGERAAARVTYSAAATHLAAALGADAPPAQRARQASARLSP